MKTDRAILVNPTNKIIFVLQMLQWYTYSLSHLIINIQLDIVLINTTRQAQVYEYI